MEEIVKLLKKNHLKNHLLRENVFTTSKSDWNYNPKVLKAYMFKISRYNLFTAIIHLHFENLKFYDVFKINFETQLGVSK